LSVLNEVVGYTGRGGRYLTGEKLRGVFDSFRLGGFASKQNKHTYTGQGILNG
jgi:hypothetical protein